MSATGSQLRVDYKPSGEGYIQSASMWRARRRFWLLLAAVVVGGGVFEIFSQFASNSSPSDASVAMASKAAPAVSAPSVPAPASAPMAANAASPPLPPGAVSSKLNVRRGDTLGQLFARNDLSRADLASIMHLGGEVMRLRTIHSGDIIDVVYDAGGHVLGLSMQVDDAHRLQVSQTANGYQAQLVDIPTETSVAFAHGVIENSLFDAAGRAGLSDRVTMQLIHLFGWDIDFHHDIRSGDAFSILYQKIHREGQPVTDGPILAAEFTTGGKTYRIVRFTAPDGDSGYYTPDGRSVRKALLRAPVAFTRISSGFSLHRMNPVLHFIRPHYGVDYAAPMGTPIVAAGDGRIVFRGRKEGFGRCVIINNGGGYTTLYAHMSRFRGGQHVGSRVKQDEVIGYVGESGEATGPHLHFQIMVDGVPRNPRTVKLPSAAPIPAIYRPEFTRDLDVLLAQLSNSSETRIATTASSNTAKVVTAH
ncbi:MAG: peptidoglycan DD-metalloendopeptidase family protein [Gammaproteobacteria bacterium]|nr:peptidoglycan DD-metalloendopeptidase family protein [Gammaproteobacteria bacterium]MDE2023189.1 peptidoglycan DD-metalloendopeptidase family protein [Gammaproteobacteria bacterium]MDE2139589.1 peptidoglycan DD-metalloendopeptidase family protein [Gammaproteobacteria bacterium]